MIHPEAIKQQAESWWPEVLRASLSSEAFFPRDLTRIGKVKTNERLEAFDRIRDQQDALLAGCKSRNGKGYRLHWEERNYRNVGRNRFIAGISIDSLEDYLYLLRRAAAYQRFIDDSQLIIGEIPALSDWCLNNPLEVEAQHGQWLELLCVVRYFLNEHRAGQFYIRELPIAVPTKFIENNRRVLSALLDAVLPPEQIDEQYRGVQHFEHRYGLKYRQPMVRLRVLDTDLARSYFSGLTDLQLPLNDFACLQLPLQRVIILENKTNFSNLMNFLTLPQCPGTAGIFGSGFGLGRLKDIRWLHEVEILYWGDLDAFGLQILSQLRGYYPHTRAFLMDRGTLDAFPDYIIKDAPESPVAVLPNLSETEQALFDYLNTNRLRLEQERIPLSYVLKQLKIKE